MLSNLFDNYGKLYVPDEDNFMGDFRTKEDAEKGHTDLRSERDKLTDAGKLKDDEIAQLKADVAIAQKSVKAKKDEDLKASGSGKHQKALKEFEDATNFDKLEGVEFNAAIRKQSRLIVAADREIEAEAEAGKKKSTEAYETASSDKRIRADILSVGEDLTDMGITEQKDRQKYLDTLNDYMNKHGDTEILTAHHKLQREMTSKELADLKKKYAGETDEEKKKREKAEGKRKNREHDDPDNDLNKDKDRKPDNSRPPIRNDWSSGISELSSVKAATKALVESTK